MLDNAANDVVPMTSEDLTKQVINTYRNALKSHSDEDCAKAFELAQKADTGNAEIQYIIGCCYRFGDGVEEDGQVAKRWLSAAAEQGHLGALCEIGRQYCRDLEEHNCDNWAASYFDEVSKWIWVALRIGDQAAKQIFGSVYVFCACGPRPELHKIIEIDDAAALTLIRAAADGEDAMAQYELGRRYEFGDGISQDYAESFKWYYKAARKGSPYYYAEKLGEVYKNGLGVEKNYDEAIKWYHKAVESAEIDETIMNLAEVYELAGKHQDAVAWYRKAAERGHEEAGKKLKKILADKECSGLKAESKINNMTYADTERITMNELSDKDYELVSEIAIKAIESNGLQDVVSQVENPFLLSLYVPIANDKRKVVAAANEIFHRLGVLPAERTLKMGEGDDYCYMTVVSDGDYYVLSFNHPKVLSFTESDEEYQCTIKYDHEQQEKEALEEEEETQRLIDGITAGQIKSKTPDGYLVLAGEYYDKIESGEKTIEYRDFTEYNLKRSIGLKTVRFNRGYGSKGKPPKQMKYEVKKVVLMDGDGNECDPFNVPEDFWPTTIAIHLGENID